MKQDLSLSFAANILMGKATHIGSPPCVHILHHIQLCITSFHQSILFLDINHSTKRNMNDAGGAKREKA